MQAVCVIVTRYSDSPCCKKNPPSSCSHACTGDKLLLCFSPPDCPIFRDDKKDSKNSSFGSKKRFVYVSGRLLNGHGFFVVKRIAGRKCVDKRRPGRVENFPLFQALEKMNWKMRIWEIVSLSSWQSLLPSNRIVLSSRRRACMKQTTNESAKDWIEWRIGIACIFVFPECEGFSDNWSWWRWYWDVVGGRGVVGSFLFALKNHQSSQKVQLSHVKLHNRWSC